MTDSDINRAAVELRQTLEHLLADVIPEDDKHHMVISRLEQSRAWWNRKRRGK